MAAPVRSVPNTIIIKLASIDRISVVEADGVEEVELYIFFGSVFQIWWSYQNGAVW